MKLIKIKWAIIAMLAFLLTSGCEKFLTEKPNQKLVIPKTVSDLQSLLDDYNLINQREPDATVVAADDYQMSSANWATLNENSRNMYIWAPKDQFAPGGNNGWVVLYNQIYKSNVVLDQIADLTNKSNDQGSWANVKGQALFIRSKCFLQALGIWAVAYDSITASKDQGIPLRLDANFNIPSTRASVEESYQRVVDDLRASAELLPVVPLHVLRPSKPAAYGLLARTFLFMGKMDSCLKYADKSLQLYNTLMDYNGDTGVSSNAEYPFSRFNPEVIYDSYMGHPSSLSKGNIEQDLYNQYLTNDLRKTLYHRSSEAVGYFKGSYVGKFDLFNGIATDELYLMRAECLARLGQTSAALSDLNRLMIKRMKIGSFVPFIAIDSRSAIELVLTERRKELVFRGLRWMDVKRLNKLGGNIILKRVINGIEYKLLPNDLGYAMPIPEDIIAISAMEQNKR